MSSEKRKEQRICSLFSQVVCPQNLLSRFNVNSSGRYKKSYVLHFYYCFAVKDMFFEPYDYTSIVVRTPTFVPDDIAVLCQCGKRCVINLGVILTGKKESRSQRKDKSRLLKFGAEKCLLYLSNCAAETLRFIFYKHIFCK